MTRTLLSFLVWAVLMAFGSSTYAQCDAVAAKIDPLLKGYLTNGQYYRSELDSGQVSSLKTTFYAGMTYRITTGTNSDEQGKVRYQIFDSNNNLLFDSKDVKDPDYWDFKIGATDTYTIKATLTDGFGCCVIKVGYKKPAMK